MKWVEHIMGFPVSVDLRDSTPRLAEEVDRAFAWLHEVDLRFSPFRADSEVCRLDRGELGPDQVSTDLRHVLALCELYERRSGGAFRARLPDRHLDPCAVVKGWAVQHAADTLRAAGARRFCINAGGDVIASGEPVPGDPWLVGVRHPDRPQELCAVLAVRDQAVATSANYERGGHIVDGRTGHPAHGLLSITIVAPDLITADTTATAAFAMGAEGPAWAAAEPRCQVFAVDASRRVFCSSGLPMAWG
jgi:FAD:protein FMN transferase